MRKANLLHKIIIGQNLNKFRKDSGLAIKNKQVRVQRK